MAAILLAANLVATKGHLLAGGLSAGMVGWVWTRLDRTLSLDTKLLVEAELELSSLSSLHCLHYLGILNCMTFPIERHVFALLAL